MAYGQRIMSNAPNTTASPASAAKAAASQIDPREFRSALGAFVTGVTIVTTRDAQGRPVGLTANSFNSVSLDPPLILWSLALASASLDAFRQAEYWAVHILASGQEALSARFARRGENKFAGLEVGEGPGGIPLLHGAAARFICRTAFEYEGGDHAIFVGRVEQFDRIALPPLVYHQGQYGHVLPGAKAAPDADRGEFGRHFIGQLLARARHAAMGEISAACAARGLDDAEYTLLAELGFDEACALETLAQRAGAAGVSDARAVIGRLAARGLLEGREGQITLSEAGQGLMLTLIAIAEATQIRLGERFAPHELSLLRDVLMRLASQA